MRNPSICVSCKSLIGSKTFRPDGSETEKVFYCCRDKNGISCLMEEYVMLPIHDRCKMKMEQMVLGQ